jgi:hypothetical protein
MSGQGPSGVAYECRNGTRDIDNRIPRAGRSEPGEIIQALPITKDGCDTGRRLPRTAIEGGDVAAPPHGLLDHPSTHKP